VRQPLMLGAGSEFNRIAGPGATPGQLNGVLLARVRTDISLVDFERSVRDFVAEIENAYWDLYFAYRDLDTKTEARDQAVDTVERIKLRAEQGSVNIEQALEQLWRFEADVVDSLNGRPLDGTRSNNGSTGGTFRNSGGVRISERRLRLIIGMPINDQRLVYPSDQPSLAKLDFDWEDSISDALVNREELRRQRWVIKQRELELIGNRSFLKPQLDAIAAYRMRGFDKQFNTPLDNDFQEWSLGLDYLMPVGYRRGHAAVRNTQLALARESQILIEQERAVHFGLSNAINEAKRAYENLLIQRNRYDAVEKQIDGLKERLETGRVEQVFVLLEAQRRRQDALVRYHQSAVEYQLAVRNVNLERGSLLSYCNVYLNESPSSDFIASQGIQRQERQDASASVHYRDPVIAAPASGPMTSAIDAVR
jgi:outer membrane protein TolC